MSAASPSAKNTKPQIFYSGKRRRRIICALASIVVLCLIGYYLVPFAIPLPQKLLGPQPLSPTYLASDGTELHQLLNQEGQRISTLVLYEELPQTLIHALLAAEDKRFFNHGGIDFFAILRATKNNILKNRVTSGASTISQQLIKTCSEPETRQKTSRTITRKVIEALQARRLELNWSKQDILAAYLNRVTYGNLFTGIHAAAQGYLNKPLRDLTPAECAFLAALPHSPTRLNPYRNPKAIAERQHLILKRMHQNGWLDEESLQLALTESIKLHRHQAAFTAPHLPELVNSSGHSFESPLQTTVVYPLQQKVVSVIQRHLDRLTSQNVTQAAAVVIENSTGHILALVGSRDFFDSNGGQINGTWASHSPGSALKPFTYLLALDHGFTAASIIPDLPAEYPTETGLYKPENYDRKYHGPVTLRNALGNSLNIPAVRLLQQLGGESLLYQTLQQFGITTLTEKPSHYGLGLTIGNAPVRLIELTNAYASLARLGRFLPWSITPVNQSQFSDHSQSQVTNYLAAYLIADILSDNKARQLTFGPRSVIRLPFPCAVKTGTSTNYRDNWTLGFTPEFTVGVWVGNFDNSPMNQVSGVTGAGPIFRDIFVYLNQTYGTTWFSKPPEILTRTIDPRLGKVVESNQSSRVAIQEHFLPKTVPASVSPNDYESDTGRAYLPSEYSDWLKLADAWQQNLFAIHPARHSSPRILSPTNGSTFILDPDLPNQGRKLLLRSNDPTAQWSSTTLAIIRDQQQNYAILEPGAHTLTLHHAASDQTDSVHITVREPMRKSTFPTISKP